MPWTTPSRDRLSIALCRKQMPTSSRCEQEAVGGGPLWAGRSTHKARPPQVWDAVGWGVLGPFTRPAFLQGSGPGAHGRGDA